MKAMIHDPEKWSPYIQGENTAMWPLWRRKSNLYHVPRMSSRDARDQTHQGRYDLEHFQPGFMLDGVRAEASCGLDKIVRTLDTMENHVTWGREIDRTFVPQDREAFGYSGYFGDLERQMQGLMH